MKIIMTICMTMCFFAEGAFASLANSDFHSDEKAKAVRLPQNVEFSGSIAVDQILSGKTDLLNSDNQILLAKKKSKKKKGRAKRLSGEKAYKSGKSSTKIDFDAVDISGQRKTPLGSYVSQSKADLEYDFVKIRLRWHPEMIQSAASLESGQ